MRKKISVFGILFCIAMFLVCSKSENGNNADPALKKARQIHEKVFTIDTHTDTPMGFPRGFNPGVRHNYDSTRSCVDFPRMKEGGLDAIFFAVFLGQGKRDPETYLKVQERAMQTFAYIHKNVSDNSDIAEVAYTPDDGYRIEKSGKRAVYIGIENGYAIGKNLRILRQYYNLGNRYVTLCHTSNNDICDSSTDKKGPEHNGLSEFGKDVVKEMNKLGCIIDVSHISDKSFYDVLELSQAPVMASHSCARALCDNPRNLTDDMIKKLAANGGVLQLCILSDYLREPEPNPERDAAIGKLRERFSKAKTDEDRNKLRDEWREIQKKYPLKLATVKDAVDHIDHIVKVGGIDHVGIGTDFDGGGGIADCRDDSQLGNITIELVKRGYTEEDIRKIWGGNFMRVFREVEKVATELQAEKN